jgi:hypothetical protein
MEMKGVFKNCEAAVGCYYFVPIARVGKANFLVVWEKQNDTMCF